MSNETDLGWLARNVHVWNESAYAAMCGGVERVMWISGAVYGQEAEFKNAVTKDQWLARRAELQKKPSWNDHPDAKWLAQDEDGVWYWHAVEPSPKGKTVSGEGYWLSNGESSIACRGGLIGDWRDTLERRPEHARAEMEVELVKAAFKPFVTIEDSQEFNVGKEQDMPLAAGIECEAYVDGRWSECYVVGFSRLGDPVIECNGSITDVNRCKFRPIRTERELAIDEMCNVTGLDGVVFGLVAGKLYDAGFRKESK